MTDGMQLWVVNDNTRDKVFKYTMAGTLVGSWTISSVNSKPTGITIDPSGASQSIWIVDNGTDRVYEYTNAGSLNSGSRAAAASFALSSGNGNPQGIADPPAPVTGQSNAAELESAISLNDLVITQLSRQPFYVPLIDLRGFAAVLSEPREAPKNNRLGAIALPSSVVTSVPPSAVSKWFEMSASSPGSKALPISADNFEEEGDDLSEWQAVDKIFADVDSLTDPMSVYCLRASLIRFKAINVGLSDFDVGRRDGNLLL